MPAGDEHGDALDPGAECLREAEASERRLRGERGMPATRAGAARLEKRRQEEAAVRGRSRQICWRGPLGDVGVRGRQPLGTKRGSGGGSPWNRVCLFHLLLGQHVYDFKSVSLSLLDSLTHSFTHSLIHSLTHSLTPTHSPPTAAGFFAERIHSSGRPEA